MMSGESVVCFRTLKHSRHTFDVCCGQVPGLEEGKITENIQAYPIKGKYFFWPIRTAVLFKKLDKENDYQVILSRVMPPNGHLAGLIIKLLKPKIKWAVYFSDPVWNSPFIQFPIPWKKDNRHRPSYWLMKLYGIPAKIAVTMSDLLVFNNERLAKYITGAQYEKYRSKICIAPYGHEGVRQKPPRKPDGTFVIAHVGQVYGNRTLAPFVAALELLLVKHPKLFSRLTVRQIGFLCKAEAQCIRNSAAASAFQIVGQIPYEESLEEMYRADCLLAVDPLFDSPEKNIYIPSKLYDYMSTGKPIFAIGDEDSATGDIMKQIGGRCVRCQTNDIYSHLLQILRNGCESGAERYGRFRLGDRAAEMDGRIQDLFL
ncbi:hypothetical protein Desde_3841 [Desulfitobacterium dehalogenans ATCC 51507]|uniref:Glycosyltransferase family 4 protein n=2 Tax=Desulfitobacterium dehalogenans TaxID=36854 RepID=I4ADS3_DESDJ|nr:hypothetical protein Desde_3841 [Desulfitobacterium dehalogenans ATCC 51507]